MTPGSERWAEIKQAVGDALELPVGARAAFLASSCSDPNVRAEAERLLRACERAAASRTFFDGAAAEFAAPLIAAIDEQERDAPTELQAELAGRYTIERQLGRGGMATVYLAYDVRHARRVALKVVSSGVAGRLAVTQRARVCCAT